MSGGGRRMTDVPVVGGRLEPKVPVVLSASALSSYRKSPSYVAALEHVFAVRQEIELVGPLGFEPKTKGFASPRRFRPAPRLACRTRRRRARIVAKGGLARGASRGRVVATAA